MSTLTTNLKLIKPELADPANITAFGENWDTLDEAINELNEAIGDKADTDHTHDSLGVLVSSLPVVTDLNPIGTLFRCTVHRFNIDTANAPTGHAGIVFTYRTAETSDATETNGVQFVILSYTNVTYTRALKAGVWEEWVTPMLKNGGQFTGVVKSTNEISTAAQLRNTALYASETYPSVNGQINWMYE